MKGRAERKLKRWTQQRKKKNQKVWSEKIGKTKAEPALTICSYIFINHFCGMWKEIRGWLDLVRKLSEMVPVGKEVGASRVTASKFDACALLSTLVSYTAHFANFFENIIAKSTCFSCQFLCLKFAACRWIKLGM
jgi:hypothetical protein